MKLSGQQRKKLLEALNDAFRDKTSLERMLAFELDKNLDAIVGGNSLQDTVFNLIKIADAEGWLGDLIRAACKSNSGNVRLRDVAQELMPNYLETPSNSLPNTASHPYLARINEYLKREIQPKLDETNFDEQEITFRYKSRKKWTLILVLTTVGTILSIYSIVVLNPGFVCSIYHLLGVSSNFCSAQNISTVKLYILNEAGVPLPGVEVAFIANDTQTEYTSQNGFVEAQIAAKGDLKIRVIAKGYPVEEFIVSLDIPQTIIRDIRLKPIEESVSPKSPVPTSPYFTPDFTFKSPIYTQSPTFSPPVSTPNTVPSANLYTYIPPAEQLGGTKWAFQGKSGKTIVEFLKDRSVKFTDNYYGTQGHWEPEGRNMIAFNTDAFSFRGVLNSDNRGMGLSFTELNNTILGKQSQVNYLTLYKIN